MIFTRVIKYPNPADFKLSPDMPINKQKLPTTLNHLNIKLDAPKLFIKSYTVV